MWLAEGINWWSTTKHYSLLQPTAFLCFCLGQRAAILLYLFCCPKIVHTWKIQINPIPNGLFLLFFIFYFFNNRTERVGYTLGGTGPVIVHRRVGIYIRYCMMCHCFNPSHSIDLMLKNWTAQWTRQRSVWALIFLFSFNFSSLSSSRLSLFKNFRNSLWLSLF